LTVVVDASIALAWALPDEDNVAVDNVLRANDEAKWIAPSHWPVEVANGLLMAERGKRIDLAHASRSILKLNALEVELDYDGVTNAFNRVLPLARAYGLTLYDALYLELAERLGVRLATLDRELRAAAQTVGVTLLP
jgi:predicted nucleic acid-binding protein